MKILSDEERDLILAALRLWQASKDIPWDIQDIATNMGSHAILSDEEIETLCELINMED